MDKNKRLFHVRFPVAGMEVNIYMPIHTPIHQINRAIGQMLEGMSAGRCIATDDTALYLASTGEPLDIDSNFAVLGIPSGEILLVI